MAINLRAGFALIFLHPFFARSQRRRSETLHGQMCRGFGRNRRLPVIVADLT
jgi:hypothetical protein